MDLGSMLSGVLSPLIGGGQQPQAPQPGEAQQQPYGITPLGQSVLAAYLGGVGTSKHAGIGNVIQNAGVAGLNAYNQASQNQMLGQYRQSQEARLNAQAQLEKQKAEHDIAQQGKIDNIIGDIDNLPGKTDAQRLDLKIGALTGHYPPTKDGLTAAQALEEAHRQHADTIADEREQREQLNSRQEREARAATATKNANEQELAIERAAQTALKNRSIIDKVRGWGSTSDKEFVDNYKADLRKQMGAVAPVTPPTDPALGVKPPPATSPNGTTPSMSSHGAAPTNAVDAFLKDHNIQ